MRNLLQRRDKMQSCWNKMMQKYIKIFKKLKNPVNHVGQDPKAKKHSKVQHATDMQLLIKRKTPAGEYFCVFI